MSLCPWLCQSGGSGAEELLGFGSCQSQVPLTPLCPCWAQSLGAAACPLHVLLSWPSLGRAVVQDRDVLLQPHTGPGGLSPCHCCPWRQGVDFSAMLCRSSGALQTPGAAEPICVSSGCQFLTPGFGDAAPPVLLPCLGASTPSSLGTPWAVPVSHCLQGTVLLLPRLGETVQCLPAGEGRFVPVSAALPCLSPVYLHPWLQGWHVPGAARPQIWLLPLACSSAGSSCFPASSFPGTAMGTVCCVLLCSSWLHPPPGAGAGRGSSRQESCQPMDLHHFPFLSPWSA